MPAASPPPPKEVTAGRYLPAPLLRDFPETSLRWSPTNLPYPAGPGGGVSPPTIEVVELSRSAVRSMGSADGGDPLRREAGRARL
mmetsp:Transcript_41951/g.77700  ORF Transcript_41951/g.77700 Transcript_41951/m.77700 type:complete len:85 (+) Transcript_41951:214-468(+)